MGDLYHDVLFVILLCCALGPLTVAAYVTHVVTAYFEAPPSSVDWASFWADTSEYAALRPGAYAMLSHAASNCFAERVFSFALDFLSRKKLVIAEIFKKLMLKFNGQGLMLVFSPIPISVPCYFASTHVASENNSSNIAI